MKHAHLTIGVLFYRLAYLPGFRIRTGYRRYHHARAMRTAYQWGKANQLSEIEPATGQKESRGQELYNQDIWRIGYQEIHERSDE